jgi:uracil phosphoribosyltransferase
MRRDTFYSTASNETCPEPTPEAPVTAPSTKDSTSSNDPVLAVAGHGEPSGRCYDSSSPISLEHAVSDPTASDSPRGGLFVSKHPAVQHKLALLRAETTEPKKFRELVRELSWLLGYEALADARLRTIQVDTPLERIEAAQLADRIGLVPILRAGLGMVDAMLELMPTAEVWHLGLFRDERTLRPVEYYNKLPDSATVDLCLILDPMLATGGSATAAIEVLKRWGASRIKLVNLIAAPEGVAAVRSAHPDVPIHTASLDRQLNERGYILPGLGDAGDRQFGTGKSGGAAGRGGDAE